MRNEEMTTTVVEEVWVASELQVTLGRRLCHTSMKRILPPRHMAAGAAGGSSQSE